MGALQNTVHYCCVSKGGQVVYAYNGGNPEIENLAGICLEKTPSYHRWYFQTMGKKTFGFLMDGTYVYFAIADEGLGKTGVLRFLEHLRDEFKKVAKRGRSMSNLDSLCLQEKLVPVIRNLVSSLDNVSRVGNQWPAENPSNVGELSPSPCNNSNAQIEGGASTKAPLLGKSSKQEKKKMKDHVVDMRDVELAEHLKSAEKGVRVDTGSLDPTNQCPPASSIPLQKDFGSMRFRSTTPNIRKKWCRQVRIILAIDALVCLVLFGIWLGICRGLECIR
ncbi:hypothetical protein M9H77_00322 [Catharanthus roseus]|nr:hypothetical protein M9H77_00322 [Catharanthus roseus]